MFFLFIMHLIFPLLFSLFFTAFSYLVLDYTITTKFSNFGKFVNKKLGFSLFKSLVDVDDIDTGTPPDLLGPTVSVKDNSVSVEAPKIESSLSNSSKGIHYQVDVSESKMNMTPIAVAGIISTACVIGISVIGYFWSTGADQSHILAVKETLENTKTIMDTLVKIDVLIRSVRVSMGRMNMGQGNFRTDEAHVGEALTGPAVDKIEEDVDA